MSTGHSHVPRKAKRDKNERYIIEFLMRCHCSVAQLDDSGIPDLLVGYRGFNLLLEVKSKSGTLTEAQERFVTKWRGSMVVVRTIHDAKLALKEYRKNDPIIPGVL